jgi:anaerobic magnesium-protoporphyrin IX monomethyl ester cyclase
MHWHSGCEMVWMGAESGSQKILAAMGKRQRVEQSYSAADQLHHAGVRVAFFLQFRYIGAERADIEKTLQMVRDCEPDDIGMSVSYPLPGTKFHERVKASLGVKQNWYGSADLALMYRGTYSTEFYGVLQGAVHAEFRLRRAWRSRHLRLLAAIPLHTAWLVRARTENEYAGQTEM